MTRTDFPKIKVWHRIDKGGSGLPATTTRFRTVREARASFAQFNNIPVAHTAGCRDPKGNK